MFSRIFAVAIFPLYLARLAIATRLGLALPQIPRGVWYRLPERAQDTWGARYFAAS